MSVPRPHAIITGGSSGIGKAIARQFLQRNAHITLIARRSAVLLQAKSELEMGKEDNDQQILILTADVSVEEQISAAIAQAIQIHGSPNWLILSAGVARPGLFQDLPLAVFEQTMATNYFGSLYSLKAALPAMQAQGEGHVVFIASGAGLVGFYGYSPYSASKFALRGLAESLRGELQPLGLRVSIVYPPDTDTPQLAAEQLTKPLATQMITATAQTWTPEAVAATIVAGIDRQVFTITPGWEMTLLERLHSLIAPLLQNYCDRLVARATRRAFPP
ncbi:SDR family oxidoreductase [Lyngbya confervoides]|uniref:3-dehydrosphinganine reductase n=1 Tax=Lyngbya confervoides BDU141951 TaxID=1574623 RepID=A0ABD4T7B0_9CYAN|nr:SDR family oxidoreductase [Lyngbya confervoides]MCM1984618.1 SDR family oxidoreductase [Lyngbya confervoides BDU141951]